MTDSSLSLRSDVESDKLIGRIRYDLDFQPWVIGQVPARHVDQHPCAFAYAYGHPFITSHNVEQPAMHIAHNCPTSLVKGIVFNTTVPSNDLERQDLDTSVGPMEVVGDTTEVTSILVTPKMGTGSL